MAQVVLTLALEKFPKPSHGQGPWEVEELNTWFEKGWSVIDIKVVPFADNTAGGVFTLEKL